LLTCKQFLSELSEYLDETIGMDERKKLEEHISKCPNCWVIADTTKRTIEVYKCSQPVEIPTDVRSRLMKALEQKMAANKSS
jgi:anti-sigma factor (TIGR02949 family)